MLDDGTVKCWGGDIPTQEGWVSTPTIISGFPPASRLLLQSSVDCVVDTKGGMWCTGNDQFRSLETAERQGYTGTVEKFALRDVQAVDWTENLALTTSGLVEWAPGAKVARAVDGLPSAVRQLTGTRRAACVLLDNHEVHCRGTNEYAGLGVPVDVAPTFVPVSTLGSHARQLASGRFHACVLADDGGVWCWGTNHDGSVGTGTCVIAESRRTCTPERQLLPVRVDGLPVDIGSLTLGPNESCAITSSGDAHCWGSSFRASPAPTHLRLPEPLEHLSIGDRYVCALFRSGVVRCLERRPEAWTDWSNARVFDLGCH